MYNQLRDEEQEALKDKRYADLKSYFYTGTTSLLEFCQWGVQAYVDFDEMARSERMETPCPEEETVEYWVLASFGELVYYSLPEMNPKQDELKAIFEPYDIQPTMGNIKLTPPGYPRYRGYKITDGKSEIGIHRWTWFAADLDGHVYTSVWRSCLFLGLTVRQNICESFEN